jgi:threonyl-tRNA synthetase
MAEHIAADEAFERTDLTVAEALERFRAEGQPYKVELIDDLVRDEGVETVSLYRNGPFTDLCRGPHAPSTGRIEAVKLSSVAGAYWRGDETRQMLTRIYGTAFFSRKDLAEHLERIEQAKARDHRRLGPELDLFMFSEESPGMPFWLPQGTVLLDLIEAEVRAQLDKHGYVRIETPEILDEELWHRSGHYDNYRENMFFAEPAERERDERSRRFAVRPMNCPGACLVFANGRHSYRELPLRMAEFGRVSRYEREGVLHGLLRVRAFTQDDAHVFCAREQAADEVVAIVAAIDELYARFGFDDVDVELSTRPEKSIGSDEEWEEAEAMLRTALERIGRDYRVNPGDGAFYGPKIDFHVTDALGRSWQLGTCQLDFFTPERFDLDYQGADNRDHRPLMIHRALLGSMERFAGILIEHYGGRFPDWLAPTQAAILPVADRHEEAARALHASLTALGVRGRVDARGESVGRKIRDAELAKVPYMLVVGDREAEAGAASVRSHADGDLGTMDAAALAARIGAPAG